MTEEEAAQPRRAIPPSHVGVLLAGLALALAGWAGIAFLVFNTLPSAFPYWLFFACLFMAVTGTALPFVRFLNARFARRRVADVPGGVLLRQSIWVAVFVTTCAWLQIPRLLNGVIMLVLAGSLAVIELFLHLRERAQYES